MGCSVSLVLCYAQTSQGQITLKEKIGQMVMVGFAGTDFGGKESGLILKAVKEGRLKENRIDESFQRIIKLKRIFSPSSPQ